MLSRNGIRPSSITFLRYVRHTPHFSLSAEYDRQLLAFLGVPITAPTDLFVDNAAVVLNVGAPIRKYTPRSKSFDMDVKYVVEGQEHAVIKLRDTPGGQNVSDMMTKPATPIMIDRYEAELQGPIRG